MNGSCRLLAWAALVWSAAGFAAGQIPGGSLNDPALIGASELAPIAGASGAGAAAGYQLLVYPVAVAASGPDLYIADAGLNRILRYDRTIQRMQAMASLPARQDTRIALGADLSLYVLESLDRRVSQFSRDGRLLRTFSSDANLGRPVAFAVDEANGRVWVVDALYNQIVAFNMLGRIAGIVRLPEHTLSASGIAVGRDVIHILDSGKGEVFSLSRDGRFISAYSRDVLKQPTAIAIDRRGWLYIGDRGNGIHVFTPSGMHRVLPIRFDGPGDIAADEGRLYLVDPLQGRVRVIWVTEGS